MAAGEAGGPLPALPLLAKGSQARMVALCKQWCTVTRPAALHARQQLSKCPAAALTCIRHRPPEHSKLGRAPWRRARGCCPSSSALPCSSTPCPPVPPHPPTLQDRHRRVKPVPKEDQFGVAPPSAGAAGDPDLALAIRMQQEELERLATHRRAVGLGAGGAAAAGAPLGPHASRPGLAGAASGRRGPSRQQSTALGGPPQGYPGQPGAAPPARRAPCLNLTTLLLLATTVAWITLYIVSLADNGWNLGEGGGPSAVHAPQPLLSPRCWACCHASAVSSSQGCRKYKESVQIGRSFRDA